jgi:hypothetical protein
VQRGSLPYSSDFLKHIADALALPPASYPELIRPLQERLGCLMYAATSTRCDIAFPVHYLCKCLQRPTPELIRETDLILSYLARLPSAGLTYTRDQMRLAGFSDASWETAASTSGWVVMWQSAALSWGSRKQKSIALSSCEAEIIALSEAAKDMVYLRKLVRGLGEPEPGPSVLATDSQSARDVSYNPDKGGVLFFPESGVVFSHTHSCAFVCMRVHSYAFHCFLHAFRRAAFYKSVAFERILQPL